MGYGVRVGIIDIGSNTARLLVAVFAGQSVQAIHEERALLALGDQVERHGMLSELKIAETAKRARAYARIARTLGCATVEVIVTAPGRQAANGAELIRALERATGLPVRVLSPEEEGALAFEGAVAQAGALPDMIGVCDVGGGSTEVVVGRPGEGPDVLHSLDIGSLRLTRRRLDGDPPGKKAVGRARAEISERFDGITVPTVDTALATGGSARALRRVTGSRVLDEEQIASAVKAIGRRTTGWLAAEHGLDPVRARTLLAGTLILAEAQRRLGVPFEVARGGLREGAASSLLASLAAA
jgi:exopolyphosphatase/guanosine-5'-triphosphate,3'-diphosphate pyrophosphatase